MEAKVYTNDFGYYTEDNGIKTWHPILTNSLNYNDNPLWPNLRLIINPAKEQVKWPVTYHYNNTTRTYYINNGAVAPDIYYDGDIDMPTKAATPRYNYRFGLRDTDSGNYIEYSGWAISADSTTPLNTGRQINDVTHLYAFF
jgi:hypothetical protein